MHIDTDAAQFRAHASNLGGLTVGAPADCHEAVPGQLNHLDPGGCISYKPLEPRGFKGSFEGTQGPLRHIFAYDGSILNSYKAIRASKRRAKATQQGLSGTIRGYRALLGFVGKTWLPFPSL